jgi:hypothetical protein
LYAGIVFGWSFKVALAMGTFNPVTYVTIAAGLGGCLVVALIVFLLRPKDGGYVCPYVCDGGRGRVRQGAVAGCLCRCLCLHAVCRQSLHGHACVEEPATHCSYPHAPVPDHLPLLAPVC